MTKLQAHRGVSYEYPENTMVAYEAAIKQGYGIIELDPVFDYVLISPGGGDTSEKNFVDNFDYLVNFFREANPNVRIVCLGNLGAHGYSSFGTIEPRIYTHYKLQKS